MADLASTVQAPPAPPRLPPPPPSTLPPPPPATPATRHGFGRGTRRVLVGVGVVLVVGILAAVVLLLRGGESAKAPPPLAAARLAGTFTIVERVTSARGYSSLKVGTTDRMAWTFIPVCRAGACTARVQFTVSSALNLRGQTTTIKLTRSGRLYRGVGRVALSSCQLQPVYGRTRISLRVLRAAWVDGVWTATRVAGALTHSSPATSVGLWRCDASAFSARIGGRAA